MRLAWKFVEEKKIQNAEVSSFGFFVRVRDLKKNELSYAIIEKINWSDSFEDQILFYIKKIKDKGFCKDSTVFTFVYTNVNADKVKIWCDILDRFKLKYEKKNKTHFESILISYETGDIFFPKKIHDIKAFQSNLDRSTVSLAPVATVLIVEDSKAVQKILEKVYSEIPGVQVVGVCSSVESAVSEFQKLKPNFISLDMNIEGGTGLDFLKRIDLKSSRCVLVTDCSSDEGSLVMDAFSMGVASYIQKPKAAELVEFSLELKDLLQDLFEVPKPLKVPEEQILKEININNFDFIAIGSSTGGTEVVRDIVRSLPEKCPPVLVVQHMPSKFTKLYSQRIERQSRKKTFEVESSLKLQKGCVYIASGDKHMVLTRNSKNEFLVEINERSPVNRFRPSVSVLFASLQNEGVAKKTLAIMLTGMGSDGAQEMLSLKNEGAITIAQSAESCVVYGMPRAVVELGGATYIASPIEITRKLLYNDVDKRRE